MNICQLKIEQSYGGYFVTLKEYDAEYTGDGWHGSHMEYGRTMDEAIQKYKEYMDDEGIDDTVEIEGPSSEIALHRWLEKRMTLI